MLRKVICLVLIASIIELSHQQDWKNARVTKLLNETVKDKQSYQMAYSYGDNSGGGNNNQYNTMQTLPPFNGGNNDNSYGNMGNNQKPSGDQIEPWRQYVRENEQFSCTTNPDGFYPSRWCNVFYRCANYIKYEFLCAQMTNGDRAWWVQHSTNNRLTSQSEAQCIFPCILNRPCTSPGGILRDQGIVSSSTADAARILNQCDRTSSSGNPVDTSNDQFRLPNGGNNCGGVPDGGFISSSYCNVFHVCTAGRRRDFLCARASNSSTYELWWNEQTKQCDWPCRVPCNKQIFGASTSAAQIAALDTSINSALCAPTSGGGSGSGSYGAGNTGGFSSGSGNMGYGSGSNNNNNNNNNMGYGKK